MNHLALISYTQRIMDNVKDNIKDDAQKDNIKDDAHMTS